MIKRLFSTPSKARATREYFYEIDSFGQLFLVDTKHKK